jgi:hypothetical protein
MRRFLVENTDRRANRQGDKGTGGQGEFASPLVSLSPCLLVMLPRCLAFAAVLGLILTSALCAEEDAKYDLHELSLWGLDPTLEQANELQHYPSAMPGVVDTERSRANEARKLTPISVITLHGEPVKDLEIDLRVQSGRFVGHWPPAESKSGRLRWLELSSAAEPGKELLLATVDEKHWFVQGRQLDALYVQDKSRAERFITYDCELKYELPVQINGGPDTYRATNSGKHPLLDLFVIVPQDEGVRVGRLKSLPPSKPVQENGDKAQKEKPAAVPPQKESKPDDSSPAEKKGEVKEEKTEVKRAAPAPAVAAAPGVAAAPAAGAVPAAVVPGGAVPAAPAQAAPAVPASPPVALEPTEIAMPPAVARDADEFKLIGEELTASLLKLGFTQQEIDLLFDRTGNTWLEGKEMIVVFRLPVEAIEERLPLVAYPAPRKTLRSVLVAVRNLDPKIKDEVQKLVAQLGSPDYNQREEAEKRLTELGRLAVPALKGALKSNDLEIVFRSERILLSQNEKLEGT